MKIRLKQGFNYGAGDNVLTGWREWHESINAHNHPVNALGNNNAGPISEFESEFNTSVWRQSEWVGDFDPNSPDMTQKPEDEGYRMISTKYEVLFPPELDPEITWLKNCNEIRTQEGDEYIYNNLAPGEWWGRYATAVSDYALARNYRVILFSISSGDHDETFWSQPSMLNFLKTAIANPRNIAIGLHEYSYVVHNLFALYANDNATVFDVLDAELWRRKIGRFEILFDVCDLYSLGGWPMLYFCEWGWSLNDQPDTETAVAHIVEATELIYGPFYKFILGFGTWYLGISDRFGGRRIAEKTNALMTPTAQITINQEFEVVERKPKGELPVQKEKIVIVKKPQKADMTKDENNVANDYAWDNYGRTATHSHDDMIRMLSGGNDESYAVVFWPERQPDVIALLKSQGYSYITKPDEPEQPDIRFKSWPTRHNRRITQWFGANPENYEKFGLPGHEGVDHRAPTGVEILAVADGVIIQSGENPNSPNYGIHVRIDHNTQQFVTIYAHLQSTAVSIGENVRAGDVIGYANNTGNSFGSHLHFGEKRPGEIYTDPDGNVWPYNFFDPWLNLQPLHDEYLDDSGVECWLWADSLDFNQLGDYARAEGTLNARMDSSSSSPKLGTVATSEVVRLENIVPENGYVFCTAIIEEYSPPSGELIDVREYFEPPANQEHGLQVVFSFASGATQPQQLERQSDNSVVLFKGEGNWIDGQMYQDYEHWRVKDGQVQKGIDTSDAGNGGRDAYNLHWAAWIPQLVEVGKQYVSEPRVTRFNRTNCVIESDEHTVDYLTVKEIIPVWVSPFNPAISFTDALVIEWRKNPHGEVIETYLFAKGVGYVAWNNAGVSEIPEGRQPLNGALTNCF